MKFLKEWLYKIMEKVVTGTANLVAVVGVLGGSFGWLGGIGVLVYQGGYWLVEGRTISIPISDIISTPQYFYHFRGLHKIIEWIFDLPLSVGLILSFGVVWPLVIMWLSERIEEI
jgi:hypothetical protein